MKKILYIGENWLGSTSLLRLNALKRLGHRVDNIDFSHTFQRNSFKDIYSRILNKLSYGVDLASVNDQIYKKILLEKYNIVWIDKGLTIKPDLINYIKKTSRAEFVVGYYIDDMFQKHNQTIQWKQGLPMYDLIVTTKSFNVCEFISAGAGRVEFVNNGYDPIIHIPKKISQKDKFFFGGNIGFVGAWEKERLNSMLFLANADLQVRWWGGGYCHKKYTPTSLKLLYENVGLWGEKYSVAISAFDINLSFLRKINRDLQTTRSIEIPACGGFMLAERTKEHLELFEETKEAEFFSDNEELLDKTKFYLSNPTIRKKIALAGRERCVKSNYSYDKIMLNIISKLYKL